MAGLALALYAVYLALAFGVRSLIQWRRTGSTGFHGVGGRPLSAEWTAGVGFALALALVRNPIFSAMLPTALGLVLLVPSWVALLGLAGLFVALELQVRVVEEPYLLETHGEPYAAYARRTGRFVPLAGRLRT